MTQNIIYWGTQVTVDYAVKMTDDQIRDFVGKLDNEELSGRFAKPDHGDIELKNLSQDQLEAAKELVKGFVPDSEWDKRGGGSPFYSTISGYELGRLVEHDYIFPDVKYNATLVQTLEELIIEKNIEKKLFSEAQKRPERPGTLSLESEKYKVMLANSEGRSLSDLDFKKYFETLKKAHKKDILVSI